ncbi:MAG: hypothetical protein HXY43_03410 [Fischerella sp.]|uniref:hypothetical protein n=1 Tax=Fischerella sp. TaxID=1191 RepID=UPI0017FB1661|nr:hypothetical protein [Fischerella sp.]NWF58373.1 hypothetical protein [Fischerella sp.]
MRNFPNSIINYTMNLMVETRSLAYLLVNKDGCLSAWGGKLAAYGVQNLQKDESVGQQVFFLEGLLPLDDFPLFLPRIKTEYGICADVHLFPSEEGDWVLLLDATLEEMHLSLIQQQTNNSILIQEKLAKILNQ